MVLVCMAERKKRLYKPHGCSAPQVTRKGLESTVISTVYRPPAGAGTSGQPPMTSLDSFRCARTLKVGSRTYAYYSLPVAEKNGLKGISRLPFSMKVLLENLLRNEDGRSVTKEDIQAV